MRICITNPCWREGDRKGIRAGCRMPNIIVDGQSTFVPFPFMLAYATAVLEAAGVEVMLLDAIAEDLDEETYFQRVCAFAPDLVINEMATASYSVDVAVARRLKELTGARIAVCGPHPSATPTQVLEQSCIDFVLVGEIEATVPALVQALETGSPLADVAGLAFRTQEGQVVVNPRRELIADLDALPYPHRATLPMQRYCVAGYPSPVLYMYASRGCPYKCNYCLWPQTMYQSGNYRRRQPETIVEEIEFAQRTHGPFKSIYFDDDTFNFGREHLLRFAELLASRPWRLAWGCNARADQFDEELMTRLAAVGLFNIRIGVESGDPEILRRAQKQLDLDSIQRCIDMAHRVGVKVHVTFTIGLSGESWESVKRTVAFAKSISPDSIGFTITTPFPGTAYYDEAVEKGYLSTLDWNEFNAVTHSVLRTEHLSVEEITRAEKWAMKQVYSSPAYLLRRFKYAISGRELLAVLRKGSRLVLGRY